MRIFISYEEVSGHSLAVALRTALLAEGVSGWVWAIDHPANYVFTEIAERIRDADYICWVCTEGTLKSRGQRWEIENAFGQEKLRQAWVVANSGACVPPSLKGYYYYAATPDTASVVVKDWLAACRTGFPDWPTPAKAVAEIQTSESEDITATELDGPS